MIPSLRQSFNAQYRAEQYSQLLALLAERCGVPIGFRVSETPCFLPASLLEQMAAYGKDLIHQLVDSSDYHARSSESIPPEFNVPRESKHPMFVQVDFGLVRDTTGTLQPKLVELQAFPSLYAYQPVLARSFIDVYGLDQHLRFLLSGLDSASYLALLRKAIVGNQDPENVILMEIDPQHQKTLPDFLVTEKLLGIKTVCITNLKKEGNRLYWEDAGHRVPVRRIYNRAIVEPEDLENYALKPLYSFAGRGVVIAPKKADIASVPREQRSQYILQERLHFEPLIETPFGGTKVEVRVMYIWVDQLTPVLTILRMGRGLMMGVDHNRNMEWVGSSAGLYVG